MNYYEVLVGTMAYHGEGVLTYAHESELAPGVLVKVPLRGRSVLAIVTAKVAKPTFDTKPIAFVATAHALPSQSLQLLDWLRAYYPAPLGAVVRLFVPPTVAASRSKATSEAANQVTGEPDLPALTPEQTKALAAIQGPGTFLLHGITGSGKSRVYAELARQSLAAGKSAVVLTPEIGLTAQLTRSFQDIFGADKVFVLHSNQTAAERRDVWQALLARTAPAVVIGPRSALFAPLRNIGLIVLDEAHDGAYKNESAPHYQSGRVAAKLAALHGATLVLGSATPSVEDYYLAQAKKRPIVEMHQLALPAESQLAIELTDLRDPAQFVRSRLLSDTLLAHIGEAMKRGEQSLLFLNRRGTANSVLCSTCGWQSLCPNCDLSLSYHGDEHRLRCHVCGYTTGLPSSCPVCGATDILFKSIGTKAVVDALAKLFPAARLQRFDTDAKKADRLERQLDDLAAGSADIIVGTQMITKGLDLPKLSVVGILNADSSLLIPDYTATEQTYQLLSQVVGRVGRGHRAGTVVVQTYDPANITLQTAVQRRWQEFYETELHERQAYRFPPFTYLLKLQVLRATSKSAEQAAEKLAESLRTSYPGLVVDGPAPSFHPRVGGKYSWQLLVKAPKRTVLTGIIASLPSGWSYDIDPINLL